MRPVHVVDVQPAGQRGGALLGRPEGAGIGVNAARIILRSAEVNFPR
jgi:hypothetical protein